MTVAELIERLQAYPRQDDTVIVTTSDDFYDYRGIIDGVGRSLDNPDDCELTYEESPL